MLPDDAYVIMDNAPIHKSRDLRTLLESSGRNLKFLPRYSPSLNPIEEIFAQLKAHQKSIRPRPRNQDDLMLSIEKAMSEVRQNNLSNYYIHMREAQTNALANKKFL